MDRPAWCLLCVPGKVVGDGTGWFMAPGDGEAMGRKTHGGRKASGQADMEKMGWPLRLGCRGAQGVGQTLPFTTFQRLHSQ